MRLADHIFENLGPPFSGKHLVTHNSLATTPLLSRLNNSTDEHKQALLKTWMKDKNTITTWGENSVQIKRPTNPGTPAAHPESVYRCFLPDLTGFTGP